MSKGKTKKKDQGLSPSETKPVAALDEAEAAAEHARLAREIGRHD
jgi:hypothetical protein